MSTDEILEMARLLVETETPSGDIEGLRVGFDLLARIVEDRIGSTPTLGAVDEVPYLYLPPRAIPSILVVGHLDTVWPRGTLLEIPFAVDGDVVTGPGIFDMKAGLAIAIEAIASCGAPEHVGLLVTGDEETGSMVGRRLVERFAPGNTAVVVPEPSADGGGIKSARKGIGIYRLTLVGRAAHAGLEPHKGASTTIELAALVRDAAELEDEERGTTVTPTLAMSGQSVNTVPAYGVLHLDVRAWTDSELSRVDSAIRARTPATAGVGVEVGGGVNRPPMEEATSRALVDLAIDAAHNLGLGRLRVERVGGASDGNLSAALGIPTLDGVGAVGGGAHARDEWASLSSFAPRARWLARVLALVACGSLGAGPTSDQSDRSTGR